MSLLLDTHVLLWWTEDDPILADEARDAIGDGSTEVIISAAAVWAIATKRSLGELPTTFCSNSRPTG